MLEKLHPFGGILFSFVFFFFFFPSPFFSRGFDSTKGKKRLMVFFCQFYGKKWKSKCFIFVLAHDDVVAIISPLGF